MRLQRTLKKALSIKGIGLHTGKKIVMGLKPAPKDNGVVFFRKDKNTYINATLNAVCDTRFATTLGVNGTKVKTVEHLLAALAGLGIDNIEIELDGPEIPILDGSSMEFVEGITATGIENQPSGRPHLSIIKPFVFRDGDAEFSALPYSGKRITYQTYYPHRLLGYQQMSCELEESTFIKEIAPARTFGFLKDVPSLRASGLARGGSLENAVILSETGVVNSTGLRFKDEFLRHKLLDFIGDISLIGFPVQGHLTARRTGHSTNLMFAKALLAASDCWQITCGNGVVCEERKTGIKYA